MIWLLSIGTCIVMHGYHYKILDNKNGVYYLSQTVTLFEEKRTFSENWKQSWINSHSKTEKCKK